MSNTRNVKLGVCRVFYNGVDLGYTQGGVEVAVHTETHKVMVDQFGKSVINETILSRTVEAKVPLAETTIDNLVRIMPGASLVGSAGVAASGTITFSAAATANDTVVLNGVVFTAKASPAAANEFGIGSSAADQAAKFIAVASAYEDPKVATALYTAGAAGVVNVTYDIAGTEGNAFTLAKSGTSATVSGATLSGGIDSSIRAVKVPTGIGIDLLSIAKKLVLHPQVKPATDKSDDFVIPLAATAGALQFAYQVDKERIFNVTFSGYPNSDTGDLFLVGDDTAV